MSDGSPICRHPCFVCALFTILWSTGVFWFSRGFLDTKARSERFAAEWVAQQCTITEAPVVWKDEGCWGACSRRRIERKRLHDMYLAHVRVHTSVEGRDLIAFPGTGLVMKDPATGEPWESATKQAEWRRCYTPPSTSEPLTVPCIVNPAFDEPSCLMAPKPGDVCDGDYVYNKTTGNVELVPIPQRCLACLGRVWLGTEEEVEALVRFRGTSSLLALFLVCGLFLPISLCCCLYCASQVLWPDSGERGVVHMTSLGVCIEASRGQLLVLPPPASQLKSTLAAPPES